MKVKKYLNDFVVKMMNKLMIRIFWNSCIDPEK